LNAEPAEVTDVRGPEEAFWICLDEIRLKIGRRSTPDRQPPVAVVVVEKHDEARLVPDEEGRATVARALRCSGNARQIVRTLASASATSRGGNRLTRPDYSEAEPA
jgi:hypothetical protein